MPRCPLCKTQADLIRYEDVPIYNCGTCGGHWLSQTRLDLILRRRDVQMPDAVKRKMIEIADASNSTHKLWCMTCGKEMVKESFKHWAEIQIDRCPGCGGIWLDRGELEKCQIFWEHMQDHPDSEETQRAARLAAIDAHWAARKERLKEQVEEVQSAAARRGGMGFFLAKLFQVGRGLD